MTLHLGEGRGPFTARDKVLLSLEPRQASCSWYLGVLAGQTTSSPNHAGRLGAAVGFGSQDTSVLWCHPR